MLWTNLEETQHWCLLLWAKQVWIKFLTERLVSDPANKPKTGKTLTITWILFSVTAKESSWRSESKKNLPITTIGPRNLSLFQEAGLSPKNINLRGPREKQRSFLSKVLSVTWNVTKNNRRDSVQIFTPRNKGLSTQAESVDLKALKKVAIQEQLLKGAETKTPHFLWTTWVKEVPRASNWVTTQILCR